ncbi:hypothetical protein IAI10_08585 [Clostridium sp. 19966]|uniref:hypothetical protein n=1 Tax=Clostridium sp. 19966 TaxID=2768166 RepID=UPI0028DF8D05|nr:hypothetical protein [Clostridium sp. 19966]MDT8716713.1 hypothetical protein [Clostridium sp. 19966]
MRKAFNTIIIIAIIVLISLGMQTAALYYVNNYYLADNTKIQYKQVVKNNAKSNKIQITVEGAASNFKLSPSGKYCFYYANDKLNVVNLEDGSKNTVQLDNPLESYFIKWHDTEDSIVIISNIAKDNAIKVYKYEAEGKNLQQALDYNNKAREYELYSSDSRVIDMQLNIMNTIIYLNTADDEKNNTLMRLDISDGISKLPINTSSIGKFFVVKQKDEIVYENTVNNKIYIYNGYASNPLNLDKSKKFKLLYVDENDAVYLGQIGNDNKINTILKSNLNTDSKDYQWQSISLNSYIDEENIFIAPSGEIYEVNSEKNQVADIAQNKNISYVGQFLDMNEEEVISVKNNQVNIVKF